MALFGNRDGNRISALIDKLQSQGKIERLEAELARFKPKRLNDSERESWHHFWGIAAFQRGDRAEALARFVDGRSACPNSADIAFSLGQEYEFSGDVSNMLASFDAAMFPKIPGAYSLAQARYAYLWNRLDKALQYVQPLLDAYYELGIADDHFVYVRGLPFFGDTWGHLGAILELQGNLPLLRQLTEQSAAKLSDYDFDRLLTFLDCIESDNFKSHFDQLNTISLQHAEHSLGFLNDVTLSEQDFPWLGDMLLLGRCEIADRFGLPERESLVKNFVDRQTLLFEPHHVFNFRLLHYQERLKNDFQGRRKAV